MFEGMKKAAIYTRVSTAGQADKEVSLQEQEIKAKGIIISKGWEHVGTYEDAGYTGSNLDRPALQQLIKDIDDKKIDAVVILKLDRLSRKQKDALTLIEDVFIANSIELLSIGESLDTTTPWGKATIGILSAWNQLERDVITERTTIGRVGKAKKGEYAGGKPPIGYKALYGELVIVPEEAEIVRLVFKLKRHGGTLMGIANELNERGYKTKSGKSFLHSAIQTILSNEETYKGRYKYGNSEQVQGLHEPILTED